MSGYAALFEGGCKQVSSSAQSGDPLYFGAGFSKRYIGSDHEIRAFSLLVLGQLPCKHGFELFHVHPQPRQRPVALYCVAAHGHSDSVQRIALAGFEQKRDFENRKFRTGLLGRGHEILHFFMDQRMHHSFELIARYVMPKFQGSLAGVTASHRDSSANLAYFKALRDGAISKAKDDYAAAKG